MGLQFQPPPDWLLKEYLDKKDPAAVAGEAIKNGLDTFVNYKQQQAAKQQAALGEYVKAFEAGGPKFAADIAARSGLQNPPPLPGATPAVAAAAPVAPVAPSPVAPVSTPAVPQTADFTHLAAENDAQQSIPTPTSPIVAHWNETMGAGNVSPSKTTMPAAKPVTLPGSDNPVDLADQGAWGQKKLTALEGVQKLTDAQAKRASDEADNAPVSFGYARAKAQASGYADVAEPFIGIAQSEGRDKLTRKEMGDLKDAITSRAAAGRATAQAGRVTQYQISDLPSRSGPSTAAGAAYGVKVAARQGQALIAKAGSAQQLSLATSDLARAVQRSAPQLETLKGADFTDNLKTKFAAWQQKLNSKPSVAEVEEIRKQMYDTFADLDQSASPWIENHLKNMEDYWGTNGQLPKNWAEIKKRELGGDIAPIQFHGDNGQVVGGTPVKIGRFNVQVH